MVAVDEIDSRSLDRYPDLARLRLGRWYLNIGERLRPTMLFDLNRMHLPSYGGVMSYEL
jgi:hypothetical protein